ncbi:hypothetical protein BD324DRAFT_651034 [Kockovaella imperatae]|uniref:NAD-dependent epimerase/dehydratase domain-containing protein n=1 Tax=Kockovaella imperatae TaxID=4999 RepID=A0A1Y1UHA7_9TREE|nr:hypothetical protein BD324DRAFT_651034 [Kockovaella imperatae]ORX37440.1 hypothetical protein BD324DRAFT_651034 [Kockovaella imperatae]
MSLPSDRLQKDDKVLIIGVTGLVGASTADALAQRGLKVVGATRQVGPRTQPLKDKLDGLYGKDTIEFVQIKDYTDVNEYRAILHGVAGIVYQAYDLSTLDTTKAVETAYKTTWAILEAAYETPSVKSIVFTSSTAAIYNATYGQDMDLSLDDYNDTGYEKAFRLPDDAPEKFGFVYSATKVKMEKTLWDFVKQHKPSFAVNTVLPHMVLGKPFNPAEGVYSTSTWTKWIFEGKLDNNPGVGFWLPSEWHIDVRDVAIIHVAALLDPEVNGQRMWAAVAPPVHINELLAQWREQYPERQFVQDFDVPSPPKQNILDNSLGQKLLEKWAGRDLISFEEMIHETIEDSL